MSAFYTQPPPTPLSFFTVNGGVNTVPSNAAEFPNNNSLSSSSSSSAPSPSSSIMIVIIVIASATIASASIYLLLRFLSRRYHRSSRTYAAADDVVIIENRRISSQLFDSLPLFSFGSVTGNLTSVDCAVCLSKFEAHDKLRLLPLCCHAFHSDCIDTWIVTNQTCPLCRSTIYPTDDDVLNKVLEASGRDNVTRNSGSFRLEIGNVSRRRAGSESGRRSYSIGSFEYVVEEGHELPIECVHRRGGSECSDKVAEPGGESLSSDVAGGGRSWLRDYVDRIASMSSLSFRSSGRFCSSRRSDVVVPVDLEAGQTGEEISEYFRWLSAI